MRMFRLLWILAPLLGVGVMSAPEWPSRAEMIQNSTREPVVAAAQMWQKWVRPDTLSPSVSPPMLAAVVAKPQPVLATSPKPVVASVKAPAAVSVPMIKDTGRVLLVGDSLMAEVGAGLRQGLPRTISFSDRHKASTGLCNKGYFDWPTTAGLAAQEFNPDWIVIHLGGNDGQDIGVNGTWLRFGSDAWKEEYRQRAERLIEQVRVAAPHAKIAWVGLPAMRATGFDGKMKTIAEQQKKAALNKGVVYLDGHQALGVAYSKDGQGPDGKRKVWRAEDGIHYSREGGRMLARLVGQTSDMGWAWKDQ